MQLSDENQMMTGLSSAVMHYNVDVGDAHVIVIVYYDIDVTNELVLHTLASEMNPAHSTGRSAAKPAELTLSVKSGCVGEKILYYCKLYTWGYTRVFSSLLWALYRPIYRHFPMR